MASARVTVVIPTFRRERLVGRAVASALTQSGVAVDVIVLDDSPEGSAADVAELRDARVRYIARARPSGGAPAVVRNEGLALASGEYVHFLDDDDELEPGTLAAHAAALGDVGVAIGCVVPFGDDPDAVRHETEYFARAAGVLRSTPTRRSLVARMLFADTPLVNSACTVRRDCALAIGGYSPRVARCEDVDFYLRAVRRGGFAFIDRPAVRYRVGAQSLMHTETEAPQLRQSYREIYRRYRADYGIAEFVALRALAAWPRGSG